MAAGNLTDMVRVEVGHLTGNHDWNAHRAESHRRGIGNQTQTGGVKRIKAQAHQQRGSNRHRRAEACRAFEEGAEGEADQQHLQALVFGNRNHGSADDVELPCFHGNFIQEHGGNDNPCNRPQTVSKAVQRGRNRHARRHSEA